jgi:hypothetical protein
MTQDCFNDVAGADKPFVGPEQTAQRYLRALLYPARFCYSWMTGGMGSNHAAVAFLQEIRPAPLDMRLIERALQCRRADADPDPLFPARTSLPSQVDACSTLLAGQASHVERAIGLSSDG